MVDQPNSIEIPPAQQEISEPSVHIFPANGPSSSPSHSPSVASSSTSSPFLSALEASVRLPQDRTKQPQVALTMATPPTLPSPIASKTRLGRRRSLIMLSRAQEANATPNLPPPMAQPLPLDLSNPTPVPILSLPILSLSLEADIPPLNASSTSTPATSVVSFDDDVSVSIRANGH
eukprot:gb/GEZN01019281.1/.p1 GENE.gb/GEZN01019281.1/~~gb/GEZN01019281.1/.p1  ORF type:complete len:197 (-),score=20.43 gb/GEZN01019281.1/:135-662(-)